MSSWTGDDQTHDSFNDWTSDLQGHDLSILLADPLEFLASFSSLTPSLNYNLHAGSPEGPMPTCPSSMLADSIAPERVDSPASFHTALTHHDLEALTDTADFKLPSTQMDASSLSQPFPRIITHFDSSDLNASLNNFIQMTSVDRYLSPLDTPALAYSPVSSPALQTPFVSPHVDARIQINDAFATNVPALNLDAFNAFTEQCLEQSNYPSSYGPQSMMNFDLATSMVPTQLALPKAGLAMFSTLSNGQTQSAVAPTHIKSFPTSASPAYPTPTAVAPSQLHFADYASAILPPSMMHSSAALTSPLDLPISLQHQFASPQPEQLSVNLSSTLFTSASRGRRSKKRVNYVESPASTADNDEWLPSAAIPSISSRKASHKAVDTPGIRQPSSSVTRSKRGQSKRKRHSAKDVTTKYVSRATLDGFLATTEDGRIQCMITESDGEICGSTSQRPGDARRHLSSAHGYIDKIKERDQEEGFRCHHCDTQYKRKDALRRHQVDGWCSLDPDQGDNKKRRVARQAENQRKAEGKTSQYSFKASR